MKTSAKFLSKKLTTAARLAELEEAIFGREGSRTDLIDQVGPQVGLMNRLAGLEATLSDNVGALGGVAGFGAPIAAIGAGGALLGSELFFPTQLFAVTRLNNGQGPVVVGDGVVDNTCADADATIVRNSLGSGAVEVSVSPTSNCSVTVKFGASAGVVAPGATRTFTIKQGVRVITIKAAGKGKRCFFTYRVGSAKRPKRVAGGYTAEIDDSVLTDCGSKKRVVPLPGGNLAGFYTATLSVPPSAQCDVVMAFPGGAQTVKPGNSASVEFSAVGGNTVTFICQGKAKTDGCQYYYEVRAI